MNSDVEAVEKPNSTKNDPTSKKSTFTIAPESTIAVSGDVNHPQKLPSIFRSGFFYTLVGRKALRKSPKMSLIIALLSANTILHGVVIARFGMRDHNQPFLVFALVYAALALLAYLSVPYALWAVLVMSLVGIVGLTVTFNKPARDKTMDKAIWVLDAITISYAAYLLFAAKS